MAIRKTNHGNMLIMTGLIGGIVCVVIVIGVLVSILFTSQKRAQGQADEIALSMATLLNKGDYSGQMNELVEYSRELVFTSRNAYQEAASRYDHLEPLARQLLEESRTGARKAESGRQSLSLEILKQLQQYYRATKAQLATSKTFMIPWLTTYPSNINRVDIGFIDGVRSNAQAPTGLPDLRKYDTEKKYIEASRNIYNGNINAGLPGADSDLVFKFSSLAAPVNNTVAPSRLTSSGTFKCSTTVVQGDNLRQASCDQLPSAVKLELLMAVSSEFGANKQQKRRDRSATASDARVEQNSPRNAPMRGDAMVTASATTNGAMPSE